MIRFPQGVTSSAPHPFNALSFVRFTSLMAVGSVLIAAILGAGSLSQAGERPNVLLLCVDDLRPELGCYGKPYIRSPNIDQLAARGRLFKRHFVQAPTCGASRYALLTGLYGPANNQALFTRATRLQSQSDAVPKSMPEWFRNHGYTTVSVGKVSHHPGGRGGPDWDDEAIIEMPGAWDLHQVPVGLWQHPRGVMHGLANGEIRITAEQMDLFQSVPGSDSIYPDGLITDRSIEQLDRLAEDGEKPFFLAVGIIRPHLPFGAPAKYMEPYRDTELPPIPHPQKPDGKTTWHPSGEFMKYNRWGKDPNDDPEFATAVRRHYAACVSYADAQIGRILQQLESLQLQDNTIVVLWGDHGWHLGEHSIWGKHSLFEESLHSPLIIHSPGMPDPGRASDAIVESIDVFPTLCELAGLPAPPTGHGKSLVANLADVSAPGRDAVSYTRNASTLRTATHRLIEHRSGELELYDHRSTEGETSNLADEQATLANQLRKRLRERLNQP